MDMLVAVALPAFADEFEHAGGVGEAAKTMGEPVVDLAKPGLFSAIGVSREPRLASVLSASAAIERPDREDGDVVGRLAVLRGEGIPMDSLHDVVGRAPGAGRDHPCELPLA